MMRASDPTPGKVKSWSLLEQMQKAVAMLADGKLPAQVERDLVKGGLWRRSAKDVVRHARGFIRGVLKMTDEEWKAGSLAFYMKMAADETLKPMERMAARARIDAIIGIDAPRKQSIASEHRGEQHVTIEYVNGEWRRQPHIVEDQSFEVEAT